MKECEAGVRRSGDMRDWGLAERLRSHYVPGHHAMLFL
jgi:hypothetical protein